MEVRVVVEMAAAMGAVEKAAMAATMAVVAMAAVAMGGWAARVAMAVAVTVANAG